MRFVFFILAFAISTQALSQAPNRAREVDIYFFSAPTPQQLDDIKKMCAVFHHEGGGVKVRLRNFYNQEISWVVSFDSEAMQSISIRETLRSEGIDSRYVRPTFKPTGYPSLNPDKFQPENRSFKNADASEEEAFIAQKKNAGPVMLWNVTQRPEEWNWSSLSQLDFFPGGVAFDSKLWAGPRKYETYDSYLYSGKSPLNKRYRKEFLAWMNASPDANITFFFVNDKVKSSLSCETIDQQFMSRPQDFVLSYMNNSNIPTTLRPVLGKYEVFFDRLVEFRSFDSFEVSVVVASGPNSGRTFAPLILEPGVVHNESRITQNSRTERIELALGIAWLASECMRTPGEGEYEDPDCECREECLYRKNFYVKVRGLRRDCSIPFPWSDPVKLAFQCEKM